MEVKKAISKLSTDEMEFILMLYYRRCSLTKCAPQKAINYLQAVCTRNRILKN